jgi:hypothetical protein
VEYLQKIHLLYQSNNFKQLSKPRRLHQYLPFLSIMQDHHTHRLIRLGLLRTHRPHCPQKLHQRALHLLDPSLVIKVLHFRLYHLRLGRLLPNLPQLKRERAQYFQAMDNQINAIH